MGLHKIDVIPTQTFVEVQRDQLVGDHIGATESATEAAIAKASGGVLFVDEAYRLSVDVFGVEAINCLMKAMTVKGKVIILAGYPKQMEEFVSVNPGLKRRITYEFTFPDYSAEDLAGIFEHQVRSRGFELAMGVTTDLVAGAINRHTTKGQRMALNGSVGEHACRHAIFSLNRRQVEIVREAERDDQEPVPSVTLDMQDIEFGCSQVPDTSSLGPSALPAAWESGKRPQHGLKRGTNSQAVQRHPQLPSQVGGVNEGKGSVDLASIVDLAKDEVEEHDGEAEEASINFFDFEVQKAPTHLGR